MGVVDLKRVAIFQIHSTHFKFLIPSMSLSKNRPHTGFIEASISCSMTASAAFHAFVAMVGS